MAFLQFHFRSFDDDEMPPLLAYVFGHSGSSVANFFEKLSNTA